MRASVVVRGGGGRERRTARLVTRDGAVRAKHAQAPRTARHSAIPPAHSRTAGASIILLTHPLSANVLHSYATGP